VPQRIGVVAVLVPHRDLQDALANLLEAVVLDALRGTRVWEAGREPPTEPEPVVGLAQQEQAPIARHLGRVEHRLHRQLTVESERHLWLTVCPRHQGPSRWLRNRRNP
jgi:hypothetical protein